MFLLATAFAAPSIEEFAETFVNAKDFKPHFSTEGWKEAGESLAGQAERKKFTFASSGSARRKLPSGWVGTVTLEVLSEGQPVDEIVLYALHDKKSWQVVYIDESAFHAHLFLEGWAPAILDVDALPTWGRIDHRASELKEGRTTLVMAGIYRDEAVQKLKPMTTYVRSWWVKSVRVGAFRYVDGQGNGVTVYLKYADPGWIVRRVETDEPNPYDFHLWD